MKNRFNYLLFLSLLFSSVVAKSHPFHIAITNIDIVGDSVKVAIRVSDIDITTALSNFKGISVDSLMTLGNENLETYYLQYLIDCFKIVDSNGLIDFKKLRKEDDGLSVWLYIEEKITLNEPVLIIENELLCNLQEDINNMVFISYKNKEKGLEFSREETKKTINLVD